MEYPAAIGGIHNRTLRKPQSGFDALEVDPLSDEQVRKLYPVAEGLFHQQDPNFFFSGRPGHGPDLRQDAAALSRAIATPLQFQHAMLDRGDLPLYYRLKIDLDSDGTMDDLLVWQGSGRLCGAMYGDDMQGAASGLAILKSDGSIDVTATNGRFWSRNERGARQIAHSLGVMSYKRSAYVDAIGFDSGPPDGDDVRRLRIYKISTRSQQLICEINWRQVTVAQ